jgi:hypothetical protein
MTNAPGCLRPRHCVLGLLFAAVLASTAVAEEAKPDTGGGVPLYREAVVCQDTLVPETEYKTLVKDYYGVGKADWGLFQKAALKIINRLVCGGKLFQAPHDAWYFFLFPEVHHVGNNSATEVSRIIYHRALVHTGPLYAFPSTRIMYDHDMTLYDIHLAAYTTDRASTLPVDTEYTATLAPNPLIGAVKKAVALVVASWPSEMAGATPVAPQKVAPEKAAPPAVPEGKYKVCLTRLDLPFGLHRATITLKDSVRDTPAAAPKPLSVKNVSVPGSSTYYLAPLTYLEIGLGAAYITRTALNQAAKVDSSMNLVDATPTTLLTYVAANWRPWGYDESDRRPSFEQDFRIVIGPALTPNPGFVFGVGFAPAPSLRPLSIQAGFGILLANVLRSGDTLGKTPQNPAHTTKRGGLGVWFIGLGYGL